MVNDETDTKTKTITAAMVIIAASLIISFIGIFVK